MEAKAKATTNRMVKASAIRCVLFMLNKIESIVFEIRSRLRLIIVDYLHVKMIIQGYYLKKPFKLRACFPIPIRERQVRILNGSNNRDFRLRLNYRKRTM